MSWTSTPTSGISVSGWNYNYNSFRTTPTSTSARFALHSPGGSQLGETHDIEFTIVSGALVLDVNPSVSSGVTANPNAFTHQTPGGSVSSQVGSANVSVGDTILLYDGVGGALNGSFIVSSEFNITSTGSSGVGWGGSFYNVTATEFSYKVFHTSAFTSPQTYELHSTTLTPTFISDLVVGAASGSINSRTHTWGTPDVVQIRDAYGTIAAELTLSHSSSNPKKVFCNFW